MKPDQNSRMDINFNAAALNAQRNLPTTKKSISLSSQIRTGGIPTDDSVSSQADGLAQVAAENIRASASTIHDAELSKEMVLSTLNSIMSDAETAMLAQANQSSEGVLQLIRD